MFSRFLIQTKQSSRLVSVDRECMEEDKIEKLEETCDAQKGIIT